ATGTSRPGPPAGLGTGPLAGYRVLDLGAILAGPYAGHLLAELGCDVVKVEPPAGDSFRDYGFTYNRGMRCVALDLRDERGREAFHRLVRTADVVLDNYRSGVLHRLGIDHAALRAVNPELVTLSVTGFGEDGPTSGRPGFDPLLQAMSGMMTAQGGDGEPVFLTLPVNDVSAAALSVLGVGLALLHRARTGAGQRAWTSLAGIAAFMQSGELVRYDGRPPALLGGPDFRGPSPWDGYHRVADGWVRIAGAPAREALEAAGLLAGHGKPEDRLAAGLAGLTRSEAVARLAAAGTAAAPARRVSELLRDEQLMAAEVLHVHRRPDGTAYATAGRFARFSRTQQGGVFTAPGVGEHSREVLREAGLDEAAVDGLIAAGVVVEGGPMVPRFAVSYR
ncbi:MAG: CaiB/BaiF CoA transferase family protein, partial [Acidimicrobiales bacterium]